ncbi:hypothetical protein B0T16DRAFT_166564 [Cercophora newfieldiana]|uniref:ADF-H domain-containing protein n=1 Tax=Cercophora newfieldiana TaxID=92897 RepID=A0AA39Y5X2_9PEZI|nr:hypothetical protein B0T16DRAFT_166564 [Cercophora newfieldiana]
MSLNGLDDAKVKEAHDAAVAEPGGWFLLKYASRDEVELLGRGNGGVVEVRNAVDEYEETSPLYGFLRYRRRNVIIKYLPDDCSRLVQARVTVHFNSVCDRFSPYDTIFSISDAKELKDTKLSAACSLHAASGSTSSSTSSLRRRRLVEIAEEEEEEERDRKRQSIVKEEDQSKATTDREKDNTGPTVSESPVKLNADLASSPEASKFTDEAEPPHFTGFASPPSPSKSFDDSGRRMSSQSARPDLYSPTSYPYGKQRVKLAPRPSADLTGRPRTSAGAATFRPVSTIPAGLKLTKTPKKSQGRDQDHDLLESPIKEEAETPFSPVSSPSPPGPIPSINEPVRPHTSSGAPAQITRMPSFKSSIPAVPPPPSKQNTMTPEKQRLLKAMKLREKRKMMSLHPSSDLTSAESSSAPSTPSILEIASEEVISADEREADETIAEDDNLLSNRLSLTKADSAIGIDVATDQVSVDTPSDSHPTSPLATSEIGDSTQASSLSESTDETVLAAKEPDLSPLEPSPDIKEQSLAGKSPAADIDGPDGQVDVSDADESESDEEEEVDNSEDHSRTEPTPDPTPAHSVPAVLALPVSKFSVPSSPPSSTEVDKDGAPAESTPVKQDATEVEAPAELATPETPQIRIPVSKFSTQGSPTSPVAVEVPSIVANLDTDNDVKAETDAAATTDGEADIASETASVSTKRSKRKTLEIRTDLEIPERDKRKSVSSFLDDDGLIDELQSATVQQAKPITVSKSAMSPLLPSLPNEPKRPATALESGSSAPRIVRTVSNPIRGPLLVPGDVSTSSARTVSSGAAFLHKIAQQSSSADLRPKSSKIGSSISQRIKALEKLSSSTGAAESAAKDRPAATFFSVRKPSGREPSRSPSVADRAGSLTRVTTPSPPESGESSPESVKRTGAMVSRLSVFEGGKPPRGRPESIQVTARIIREPNQRFPKIPDLKADPADYEPLDLKQSPLLVNVQKRSPSPNPSPLASTILAPSALAQEPQPEAKQSLLQRRFSKERRSQSQDREAAEPKDADAADFDGPRPRRRSSLTVVKDFIKDRRESLLGARSPSTDNLGLSISPSLGGLASPAVPTPGKSPSSRPPSVHQNSIFPRRLSISSRRSSMDHTASPAALSTTNLANAGLSPPTRTAAEGGDSEAEGRSVNGHSSDKKSGSVSGGSNPTSPTVGKSSSASRASRFMRRLSNSLSSSKKNVPPSISPTVAEEEDAEVEAASMGVPQSRGSTATGAPSYHQPTIVSHMGDVNVQFPDNLLWKRRTICLDSQGFLILSAVQGATAVPLAVQGKDRHHQAGAIKRYHMSDFKTPYTPEMEVQELPNSVILDFVDGSGLQIACEDRAGQMNVLHVLQEAHHSHTSFGL